MVSVDFCRHLTDSVLKVDLRRQHRRIMHHDFHPAAADRFKPHTLKAARDLLLRWVEDPNDILAGFKQ